MALPRIRIVTPALGGAQAALRNFLLASFLVHAVVTVALVLIPELRRGPRVLPDSLVVDLVGALPSGGSPAVTAQSAPAPEPPPPEPPAREEEVRVRPAEPEPAVQKPPEKKPDEKPDKKPEPAPERAAAPPPPSPTPPAATPPGAGQGETAGSAEAGASVSALDVGGTAFAWYRAAVTNALYGSWRRPVVSGLREPIEVRVAFEIMRDGNVRGVRIEQPSGVPTLDRSALRAVADSAPLPPLPATLTEPYLPASFVFRLFPEGY